MKIEETNQDGTIILFVTGKMLVGADDDRLRQTVEKHVATGHTEIVLDLDGLTYIDSAGLGEIVQCRAAVVCRNGTLKLRRIPKRIYDRLSVTRLVSLFEDADEPPTD